MATYAPAKKNVEYITYVSLASQSDANVFQANPTLAAGDVKVSTDGGSEANITTLPVVTPASSKWVKVTLSASEMNGDNIAVMFSDAAGDEWKDMGLHIHTVANQFDDLPTNAEVNAEVDTAISDAALATAASLATAQTDLDTLTGLDGVTLATSQPNYAPNTTTPPTAAAIRSEVDSNSTQLAAIVADTNELQGDWADGGRLDLLIDAILEDTGTTLPASISALNDLSASEVNTEVVDALATDTYAEPGSVPAASATLAAKIGWLYLLARNKRTQTATTHTARNDADDGDVATSTVSDDGTTLTLGEWS